MTDYEAIKIVQLMCAERGIHSNSKACDQSNALNLVLARASETEHLRDACAAQNETVCQILGKALGNFPRYVDDQVNFPGATEEDGVCVGEHVAESMAAQAANRIKELETENARLGDTCTTLAAEVDIWKVRCAGAVSLIPDNLMVRDLRRATAEFFRLSTRTEVLEYALSTALEGWADAIAHKSDCLKKKDGDHEVINVLKLLIEKDEHND